MGEYSEHADLSRLRDLRKLAATEYTGFVELDENAGRIDGAVPKYRQPIALGVALTTQRHGPHEHDRA